MHSLMIPRVGWALAFSLLPSLLLSCDPTPSEGNGPPAIANQQETDLVFAGDKKLAFDELGFDKPDNEVSTFEVELCPDTRRIGLMSNPAQGCKDVDGWTAKPLWRFDEHHSHPKSTLELRKGLHEELSPYCVYVWEEPGTPPSDAVAALDQATTELYPDCLVAVLQEPVCEPQRSMGNDDDCTGGHCRTDTTLAPLRDAFLTNLGLVGEGEEGPVRASGQVTNGRSQKPVKVVVIDSAGGHGNTSQRWPSPHGVAMAKIIEDVVSLRPHASPSIAVERVLGMSPIRNDDGSIRTCGTGGYYGYQTDLIDTVADVLGDWDSARENLIINLSVGWEPGGAIDHFPAFRNAVHRGRCAGALVFAAAGNHHPGTCIGSPGAMLPAAWQSESMACEATGSRARQTIPVLYAVSAVDEVGTPLMSNRPGSEAPLAALGHLAVVHDPHAQDHYYGPISGSSVATAVASATAAGYWAMNTGKSAEQVVADLYGRGVDTRRSVTLSADMPLQKVISPCAWTGTCDSLLSTVPAIPRRPEPMSCAARTLAEPVVVPQPDTAACWKCGIKPPAPGTGTSGGLELLIDAAYQSMMLTKIVLTLDGVTTQWEYTEATALATVNTTTKVTFPIAAYPTGTRQGYVTMYFRDRTLGEVISGNQVQVPST